MQILAQNFDIYQGDNLHPFARTGAISLDHLLITGIDGVILGHSEVGDSPDITHKKFLTILNHDKVIEKRKEFTSIILFGERWEEFEGKTLEEVSNIVLNHCQEVFDGVKEDQLTKLIIGYEPKWGSRGSGKDYTQPPQPELISLCIKKLKSFLLESYKNTAAFYIYGGRSTPERTEMILADENIDGLILGSACNTVEKTLNIIESMKKVKKEKVKVTICNFKAYSLSDSYEKYINELKKLPSDNVIYFAPPYTDLYKMKELLEKST